MRVGSGYDVHRLGPDRKLIIGGEEIPYDLGLIGHSDADVLLHAVMDALLGAAALGDIGLHFPDTDERYRGISSVKLLEEVARLLEEEHWIIENIDSVIIAQRPKMRPYIDRMRENIARALKIEISQVNVKATTEEGLGFTGSGQGISAQAVCMLSHESELTDGSILAASSDDTDTPIRPCGSCCGCIMSGSDAPDVNKKEKKNKKKRSKKKKEKRS